MIALAEIRAARERIADVAVRTPLIRLRADGAGKVVCIVSGGNIDFGKLAEILAAPSGAAVPGGEG